MFRTVRLTALVVVLLSLAAPAWATPPLVVTAGTVRPANEGLGCTLSGWHPVVGDLIGAASTHATITYGAPTRAVATDNRYHDVAQGDTIRNTSVAHAFYETRFLIGHSLIQANNTFITTTYDGAGTFVGDSAPTGTWAPRANVTPTFRPVANTVVPSLITMRYADSGAPVSGTLSGHSVSVDPQANVPAYEIGTINPGQSVAAKVSAVIDRPQNTGSYGWLTADLVAARTCLPNPTVASWTNGSGLTPITGTGDYVGDQLAIRTSSGALLGTAVVGADLTWSFTPTTALPAGLTTVTVTETDEFGLTGTSSTGDLFVAVPGLQLAKTTAGQSVAAAPGPTLLTGSSVAWTFTVTNTGNVTLANVAVTDTGSDSIPVQVTCAQASLPAGGSMPCHATGTVGAGQYRNTATVTGTPVDTGGATILSTVAPTASADSWYRGVTASVALVKTADTSTVTTSGTHVGYTFAVTNTGTGQLTGLSIDDQLTAPASPALTVTCPTTTVDPGATVTCTGSYLVTQADLDHGSIVNTATASGTVAGQTVTSAASTARVSVVSPASQGAITVITGEPGPMTNWALVVAGLAMAVVGGVALAGPGRKTLSGRR